MTADNMNFEGHVGPGTCLILVGLFLLLRSLNVSLHRSKPTTQNKKKRSNNRALLLTLPLIPSMRSQKIWLSIEGILFLIFSLMGALVEIAVMIIQENQFQSHIEHLKIFLLLAICGFFFLMNFHSILNEMAWSLVYPISLSFAGFLLGSHEQDSDFRTLMYTISAYSTFAISLCRIVTLFIGYHSNRSYHQKIQRLEELNNAALPGSSSGWSCFGAATSNNTGYVIGINSMYSNPFVFATPFPFVEAVLVIFTGVWWWVMAILFYVDEYPKEIEEKKGTMLGWSLLFKVCVGLVIGITVFCLTIPSVVNRYFPPDSQDRLANPKEVSTNDNRFEN